MGTFSSDALLVGRRIFGRAAPQQAGIFVGSNPAVYNASDPYPLWVIQIIIIIGIIQILSIFLSRIRQPRVIAEVIAGIILGPSVMGHIPNFSNTIFPTASLPLITLTSTLGVVLFLFIVGLEIDVRLLKRNARASAMISVVGLLIPLGLGAALAVPLYHQFASPSVSFGNFILFVAVAVGITAFPVLCRILSELKLLDTTVGVVVLGAGVGNDLIGWILLALAVALVNASNGLTALYVLLTGIAFVLFMIFPVRWAFRWIARKTGSLETGQPTTLMMTLTLFIVLFSAFFTDIIGIHPIFGGFLAGLAVPHDNGFAIAIVEKMEDLVSIIFLPLYFALSGLRTNLGLLNNGVTWGYTILICVVSFFSKFLGCSIMAKISGFNIRESGAIGTLMSCKGLVELIVLNVGLQANILNPRIFSMFVLHALILTFMTTPLTIAWYPPSVRVRDGFSDDTKIASESEDGNGSKNIVREEFKTKFSIILDKIEQLPAMMTITQLLQPPSTTTVTSVTNSADKADELSSSLNRSPDMKISLDTLRLIELTDRTSAVLKSQEADFLIYSDPIVSVFRTFGFLNHMQVTASLSVVSQDEFSSNVVHHVRDKSSQMVIIPWKAGSLSVGPASPTGSSTGTSKPPDFNPFHGMFRSSGADQPSSTIHSNFIRRVFAESPADVALVVDRGVPAGLDMLDQHIFLPFFGGPDDRLALTFVVQLCMNSSVSATIVKIRKDENFSAVSSIEDKKAEALHSTNNINTVLSDTVYGLQNTQTRLASDTIDNILWEQYSSSTNSRIPQIQLALDRVNFSEQTFSKPLHSIIEIVSADAKTKRLLVVVGRSRSLITETHQLELKEILTEKSSSLGAEVPKTLGDVATALVAAGVNASMLVMQATLH